VVRSLFLEDNLYIKDCAGKSLKEGDRYIRVAARGRGETDVIVKALKRIVGSSATRPRAASSVVSATL
jgi:histidinol-phosphate/aromatic aminotransferase/cobyric acid decarboxylase-like protein